MKIGVLCPSEIALRRFMPALQNVKNVDFVGLAVNTPTERYGENLPEENVVELMLEQEKKKALEFIDLYGGRIFDSYEAIVISKDIDAIYIPLPPGLHYVWAKKALENGKHVLVEKPATTSYLETKNLIEIAASKELALHENYMFSFHSQLDEIDKIIKSGELGDVRLYQIKFGFPRRGKHDFRYIKSLGGGALFDAGGYVIKYATRLLGDSVRILYAKSNYVEGEEVDIFGSGALVNDKGITAQIAFGMDNDYKCDLEVWGSKACLTTGRILTAPVGFEPVLNIKRNNDNETIVLAPDDTFKKSIEHFLMCIDNKEQRENNYNIIKKQASLVDEFLNLSVNN